MPESPLLIVGLGNPGPQYALTRHNLGFIVVDLLADRWQARSTKKFQGEFFGPTSGAMLLKPHTYMNLSGKSVLEALQFYKVPPETGLLVVTDDLDLPAGQLRLRKGGGPGGHNGLKSIIELLGTEAFARLRIGIGRPAAGPTEGYVLARIPKSEEALYQDCLNQAADAVETVVKDGLEKAMNLFNRKKETP